VGELRTGGSDAASKGTVPTASVATAFEQHSSLLPANSTVLGLFQGLASQAPGGNSPQLQIPGYGRITVRLPAAREWTSDVGLRRARLDAKQGRST